LELKYRLPLQQVSVERTPFLTTFDYHANYQPYTIKKGYYISLLLLLFNTTPLFAQNQQLKDSLDLVIAEAITDSAKSKALIKASNALGYNNPKQALNYALQAEELATAIEYDLVTFDALRRIGDCYHVMRDFNNGLKYCHKAMQFAESKNDSLWIGHASNTLGLVYEFMKNHEKALEYYKVAILQFEKAGKQKPLSVTHNNIANTYHFMGENNQSLVHHRIALKMRKEMNDEDGIAWSYNDMGLVLMATNKMDSARSFFESALKAFIPLGDVEGEIIAGDNLGVLEFESGNYHKAIQQLEPVSARAAKLNLLGPLEECYDILHKSAAKLGDTALELKYYKAYIEIRDSIFGEENTRKITQRELTYEFNKQQLADSLEHAQEVEMQGLELKATNLELEAKAKEEKQQKQQKNNVIRISSIVGLFLLTILAIVYRSYQKSKKAKEIISKQKKEVEHQKMEVEEKNKEILDSITYAKRLQEAILPPRKLVKEYLQNSFILYKPKDIVAGDFYWMQTVNDTVLFAAADCTGHGVPGAMVSVVCSNALNRGVKELGISDPGKLLDTARELVVERFALSESEVKDGMDISLCALNTKTNTLKYAGANNPLWIVRNGEVLETKANKQPIGKTDNPEPFNTHTIQLQKEDSLYLFTDGFADQFGGERGKKYKYRPFKQLLIEIQDKSLEEQRDTINTEFETWKGDLEQVDDVCIIGVKI
jgi:serine phosphatase RsbU (regulator of sigma subunit)